MNETELRTLLSPKFKIIRAEFNYTQDEMANMLGVSKKTLVQIEKGRTIASWPVVVTLVALFRDSQILQQELGDEDVVQIIQTISRKSVEYKKYQSVNQNIWWSKIDEKNGYILQKNKVTNHYQIVDQFFEKQYSTFDKNDAQNYLEQLQKMNYDDHY